MKMVLGGHPFSTYAVRGRGGGKILLVSLCTPIQKLRTGRGRGSKMAKMLRTYYMDAPLYQHV